MSHTMHKRGSQQDKRKFHKLKDATKRNKQLVTPMANTPNNLIDISPPLASRHQKGERLMLKRSSSNVQEIIIAWGARTTLRGNLRFFVFGGLLNNLTFSNNIAQEAEIKHESKFLPQTRSLERVCNK